MSDDELTKKYLKFAEPSGPLHGLFTVKSVTCVNFKPHPFMVGPKHVEYASRHCCGMLGEEALAAVPCYHQALGSCRCNQDYREHTSDRVLFVQLLRNLANKEAADALFAIKEDMIKDKIDGVAFVDTPEKFRIAEAKKEAPCESS